MINGNLPVWHAVKWDKKPNLLGGGISLLFRLTAAPSDPMATFFLPVHTFWTKAIAKGFLAASTS